jgi:hypothetical protein
MTNTINFDDLPDKAPGMEDIEDGVYDAVIEKAEMTKGKNPNKPPYLALILKLQNGRKVYTNLFQSDKAFPKFILGRLLNATGISLSGSGTLFDVQKVIQGKQLRVAVTTNDRGYPDVDFTNGSEGFYKSEIDPADVVDNEPLIESDDNEAF